MRAVQLTFEEAVSRVRAALASRAPRTVRVAGFRAAAVLVALLDRPGGPTLLFTRRSAALPHHRGEVSYPGGGLLPGEAPEAGALREAQEEVGLAPERVEVLGRLDDLVSMARFTITPVVGALASPPAAFRGAEAEVQEVFELPLARLLDPAQRRSSLWDPARLPPDVAETLRETRVAVEEIDPTTGHWRVWSFHADPARVVWGLSGRMLVELIDRAFGERER
jgi:8-oxo-dGTP pyrophosphatase MutT (NUDIX family)